MIANEPSTSFFFSFFRRFLHQLRKQQYNFVPTFMFVFSFTAISTLLAMPGPVHDYCVNYIIAGLTGAITVLFAFLQSMTWGLTVGVALGFGFLLGGWLLYVYRDHMKILRNINFKRIPSNLRILTQKHRERNRTFKVLRPEDLPSSTTSKIHPIDYDMSPSVSPTQGLGVSSRGKQRPEALFFSDDDGLDRSVSPVKNPDLDVSRKISPRPMMETQRSPKAMRSSPPPHFLAPLPKKGEKPPLSIQTMPLPAQSSADEFSARPPGKTTPLPVLLSTTNTPQPPMSPPRSPQPRRLEPMASPSSRRPPNVPVSPTTLRPAPVTLVSSQNLSSPKNFEFPAPGSPKNFEFHHRNEQEQAPSPMNQDEAARARALLDKVAAIRGGKPAPADAHGVTRRRNPSPPPLPTLK